MSDTAQFILTRLADWGVKRVYGYPGDGINGLLGAFHKVGDRLAFIQGPEVGFGFDFDWPQVEIAKARTESKKRNCCTRVEYARMGMICFLLVRWTSKTLIVNRFGRFVSVIKTSCGIDGGGAGAGYNAPASENQTFFRIRF